MNVEKCEYCKFLLSEPSGAGIMGTEAYRTLLHHYCFFEPKLNKSRSHHCQINKFKLAEGLKYE